MIQLRTLPIVLKSKVGLLADGPYPISRLVQALVISTLIRVYTLLLLIPLQSNSHTPIYISTHALNVVPTFKIDTKRLKFQISNLSLQADIPTSTDILNHEIAISTRPTSNNKSETNSWWSLELKIFIKTKQIAYKRFRARSNTTPF